MNLCQCEGNCGQEVTKEGNRFIKGHYYKGKHLSPETKQLMSDSHKGMIFSNEHKRNIRINHADFKGENHPQYGTHLSDEHKKAISDNNTGRLLGEKHPNWKGGISKEPYCQEFDRWFKEEIKNRDNYQCQNPDCIKEITKTNQLCVHHINYDKKNCSANNLITICRNCNSRANANREYWQEFYSNILWSKII